MNVSQLTFDAFSGGAPPATQTIRVSNINPDAAIFDWSASVTTTTGGDWLRLGATSGTGETTVPVSISMTGLTRGVYRGEITISSALPGSPQKVAVTLNIVNQRASMTASGSDTQSGVAGAVLRVAVKVADNAGAGVQGHREFRRR